MLCTLRRRESASGAAVRALVCCLLRHMSIYRRMGPGAACDARRRVASASVGRCMDPVHLRRCDLRSCLLRRKKVHALTVHVVGSPRASMGSRHKRWHEIYILRSIGRRHSTASIPR
jgi:hypothetical protein